MTHFLCTARRWLLALASLTCAVLPLAAVAGPLDNFSFSGEGNVSVFDAMSGGWVGSITEFIDPNDPPRTPLSFVSVVTFTFDASMNKLLGNFEFTTASDLSSSLFGTLMGSFTDPASTLASGGQLGLDYSINGGTGAYSNYRGFGLSFLSFDPSAITFNNYTEQGLLVAAAVPEPATVALFTLGLALLCAATLRRRRALVAARRG